MVVVALPFKVAGQTALRLKCVSFFEQDVPDVTKLLHFWHLLEEHGIGKLFFDAITRCLERTGRMMQGSSIVDATLISEPSSAKNAEKKRGTESTTIQADCPRFQITPLTGNEPSRTANSLYTARGRMEILHPNTGLYFDFCFQFRLHIRFMGALTSDSLAK